MSVLRWEEPNQSINRRGAGWTAQVIADLKARPNEWAVIEEAESSDRLKVGTRSQNLHTIAARQGVHLEVAVRTEAGTTRLYARFISEKE